MFHLLLLVFQPILAGQVLPDDRVIDFPLTETKRLAAIDVPLAEARRILSHLGFMVAGNGPAIPRHSPAPARWARPSR